MTSDILYDALHMLDAFRATFPNYTRFKDPANPSTLTLCDGSKLRVVFQVNYTTYRQIQRRSIRYSSLRVEDLEMGINSVGMLFDTPLKVTTIPDAPTFSLLLEPTDQKYHPNFDNPKPTLCINPCFLPFPATPLPPGSKQTTQQRSNPMPTKKPATKKTPAKAIAPKKAAPAKAPAVKKPAAKKPCKTCKGKCK